MGITGAALVLFLLFHSMMNVVVLFSEEAYNAVCAFLGANWYAVVATMGLTALVGIHFLYAVILTFQNRRARGKDKYAVTTRQEGVEWSSKNMFILGLVICCFLVLHLYQFWAKMQFVELTHLGDVEKAADGAYWINFYFRQPLYAITYIVLLAGLWFHLTHGIWSAMQSFGLSNKTWLPRWKSISNIVSTIIIALFMAVPIVYLIKSLIG
jgi:succinate dehydrogenase / fumarate reductase cytochrome b subunit